MLNDFKLPENFLFGVTNSQYQTKGCFNDGDGPFNNWQNGNYQVSLISVFIFKKINLNKYFVPNI